MRLETAFQAIEAEERRLSKIAIEAGIATPHSWPISLYCSDGTVWCRITSGVGRIFTDHEGRCNLTSTQCVHRNAEREIAEAAERYKQKGKVRIKC